MKPLLIGFILIIATAACQQQENYTKAEDAQEAATEFIRATLDGNYNKAYFYLYKDSAQTNSMLLNRWKTGYDKLSAEEKINFKESNIIVVTTEKQNDSTLSFTYSNSFKNKKTTLKIIRFNGEWVVDFKDFINQHD
jgi:Domain of unknown function (DUF4878)